MEAGPQIQGGQADKKGGKPLEAHGGATLGAHEKRRYRGHGKICRGKPLKALNNGGFSRSRRQKEPQKGPKKPAGKKR